MEFSLTIFMLFIILDSTTRFSTSTYEVAGEFRLINIVLILVGYIFSCHTFKCLRSFNMPKINWNYLTHKFSLGCELICTSFEYTYKIMSLMYSVTVRYNVFILESAVLWPQHLKKITMWTSWECIFFLKMVNFL